MSCNESLKGHYTIKNKTEFNKVIKAMVDGANERLDYINKAVKAFKQSKVHKGWKGPRFTSSWWLQFDQHIPTVRRNNGWRSYSAPAFDTECWGTRRLIEHAVDQRGKLPKINKWGLNVEDMTINIERQTFSIDVGYENHAVDYWASQAEVQAFFTALESVKWRQRGDKDGGYCQYECEYNDSPNYRDFYGRRGKDMQDWVLARPF